MSSIERQSQQTYWCHECDMSIHLLVSTDSHSPLCPDCHTHHLELMDSPSPPPISSATTTDTSNFFLDSFFFPFFSDPSSPNDTDNSSNDNSFDSILPTIKITASFLLGDDEDDSDSDPVVICGVCKDEFVIDVDDAKLLPCNHLFHPHCILPWLNSNHNSCPLCRFHLLLPSSSNSDASRPSSSSSSQEFEIMDCASFPDVGALSNYLPSHF